MYEARTQGRSYDPHAQDFLNKPAPNITLRNAMGADLTLSLLRGKPVFLDFWASSCAPCVAALPKLSELHREARAAGIAWFSIDNDQVPERATKLLAEKHVAWTNYHDADGVLGAAFKLQGVPLGVLIDANGKVVFYEFGFQVSELKKAIASLGPQYASISAKPSP
ncbi:MAG TPA: TlpA disulfide reductase family protein [Terriglobales bacterium]|jgi:thiol-disulfide isomerase/thioredoxin